MASRRSPSIRWKHDALTISRRIKDRPFLEPVPPLHPAPETLRQKDDTQGSSKAYRFSVDTAALPLFLTLQPHVPLWLHQQQGAAFMAQRMATARPCRGGLLCDNMRLGKTRTALAWLLRDLQMTVAAGETRFRHPYLICCPSILVDTWIQELETLLPTRPLAYAVWSPALTDCHQDIVFVNYSQLQHEAQVSTLRDKFPYFRAVLCDEAHIMRNEKTLANDAIALLPATAKWFISGTPMHNSLDDIRSALKLIGVPHAVNLSNEQLRDMLKEVYLRRELVDDRPLTVLPMTRLSFATPLERVLYNTMATEYKLQARDAVAAAVADRGVRRLEYINMLRQLCLSPAMVADWFVQRKDNRWTVPPSLEQLTISSALAPTTPEYLCASWMTIAAIGGNVEQVSLAYRQKHYPDDTDWHALCERVQALHATSLPTVSTKERFVMALMGHLERSNEKALVLSNYREPLQRLFLLSQWRRRPVHEGGVVGARKAIVVQGTTSDADRKTSLERFRNSSDVSTLLMTLPLGNYGHDFTCASHIILCDPWYNPRVEMQAVYRLLGPLQQKTVRIHRLAIEDTIDEHIVNVANAKLQLECAVLPEPQLVTLEKQC